MSITIGNYSFEGPYANAGSLNNQSGVYAILTLPAAAASNNVIDIGESTTIRERIENHNRKNQWTRENRGSIHVGANYCNELARIQIEAELRRQFNPPCGDR